MVFGRKKGRPKLEKEPEETLPVADDEENDQKSQYDEKIAELNERIKALDKKATKAINKEETLGEFSLDENEMALAVNALANSEPFKLYRQMVLGQQIAKIIDGYNKVVGERNEIQGNPEEE